MVDQGGLCRMSGQRLRHIYGWLALCVLGSASVPLAAQDAAPVVAWQSMRVMALDSFPSDLGLYRLREDAAHQAILLNRRRSEVMVLRYLHPAHRQPANAQRRPNDPPMVPEISRDRTVVTGLPLAMVAADIPGLGRRGVVLTGPIPRLVVLRDDGQGPLVEERVIQLLPGRLLDEVPPLLSADGASVVVALRSGMQRVPLAEGQQAQWLSPRERMAIRSWLEADADGDGQTDLVDWVRAAGGGLNMRWRRSTANGWGVTNYVDDMADFRADDLVVVNRPQGPAEVVALPQRGSDELRIYALERGATEPFGRRQQVHLPNRGQWVGMLIDQQPSLVVADEREPRLLVWSLSENGFVYRDTWPGVSQVRSMVESNGQLLMLREGAGDLLVSRWEGGRLSFPQPRLDDEALDSDRALLALSRVGSQVWWVQRVGADLFLYLWHDGQAEPVRYHFPDAGAKVQRVQWLGEGTLIVQDQFAPGGRLLHWQEDGSVVAETPPHLARIDMTQYRLFDLGNGQLQPARLADGVLQWCDRQAAARDQVMLDEGLALSDVMIEDAANALVLEQGGERLHRLQADEAGVLRPQAVFDLGGGRGLRADPYLGLILERDQGLLRLDAGEPWIMALQQVVDYPLAQQLDEAALHRLRMVDITGDGNQEIVAFDDSQHRLTVFDPAQGYQVILSWQVFSDDAYPYGYRDEEIRSEPRLVAAGDLTGDGRQDLLLISHDRLLLYLAASEEEIQ